MSEADKHFAHPSPSILAYMDDGAMGAAYDIAPSQITGQVGKNERTLDIRGAEKMSDTYRIGIQIEAVDIFGNPPTFFPNGPIIATVTWGAAGGRQQIEFDVPAPTGDYVTGNVNDQFKQYQLKSNGATLALFGSAFFVDLRNDANAATLVAIANDPDNISVDDTIGGGEASALEPVRSFTHVGHGSAAGNAILRRSIRITRAGGIVFGPGGQDTVECPVPAFARRVRFPRNPDSVELEVTVETISNSFYTFTIPASSNNEFIDLPASAWRLFIQNLTVTDIIAAEAQFELVIP